ncbi:transporter substrate-binding domain-containing protein [Maritimibacter sp. 55A14]|uniref:transporter substrate-binding domain-containing protein n=1 Tax=Maritimibacter sp. 55A14 TaxID=2174844 RepID=UPI0013049C6B|nr:transporter substrate-binding domain-containing protein [Maritimibacter sp. 55A14]
MKSEGRNQKEKKIEVGILFSTSGPYGAIGQELQNGALLAISQVNADSRFDFELVPTICDPSGDLRDYYSTCIHLLKNQGIKHVIGCYTSSSRKEIIPVFEKYDGLLWYPSHYEGFESSGNVIYTGSAPNQHIVPLMAYMLQTYGGNVCCVGSNYIWGWESNRIMREGVSACGGSVLSERYVPVGSVDVDDIVEEIIRLRPSYIFSSLIGISSETFMRSLYEARRNDTGLQSEAMPVCSNTLSEPELAKLSPCSARGHIASSVYFQSIECRENQVFIADYKKRYGGERVTSADAEAAFNASHMLAESLQKAHSDDLDSVKQALYGLEFNAPQGKIWIEPSNNHCYLTPSLGISNEFGQFDIIQSAQEPVRPDPYLVDFKSSSLVERQGASSSSSSFHVASATDRRAIQ